jgi:elongation factor Tu
VLVDCADHASWVKRLVIEPNRFDGAILVVDAVDGPQATTREQLLLASELGISSLVVFLNKCDAAEDDEMLFVTEMETRELLDDYGFDGTSTPVIRGSALAALNEPGGDVGYVGTVRNLIEAMDDAIPTPEPVNEQPFLMQVYEPSHSPKNEEVAFGWVERGTVRVGEEVEIVGISKHALRLDVTRIRALRKDVDAAKAGDNVEVWLGWVYRPVLQKGHVLACPGSIGAHSSFEAEVYALRTDEGGRQTPFYDYDLFQFNFGTDDFEGAVELSEGLGMVMPGDRARIYVGLDYPVAMERGTGFYIREGGRTVGMGTVTAYGDLEDEDDLSFYVDDEEEEEEPLSETSDDEGDEE